jgi:hypothetical protein
VMRAGVRIDSMIGVTKFLGLGCTDHTVPSGPLF